MKKLLLILNPIAGTKKITKNVTEIISKFNRAGFDVHAYVTACKADATSAVGDLGKDADIIVCCGGDGTLNETITGVIENGMNTSIGYIPSGSTNDFANSFSLPMDAMKAVDCILEGNPTPCDIGIFGEHYFSYVASFGAFTKASYSTPQSIKNALGGLAYFLEGIEELSNISKEHIHIEIDGEIIEDDFLFGAVCNSTSIGGIITLQPDMVDMSDGMFEILLVKAPKDIQELGELIVALASKNYSCKMINIYKGNTIKVHSESDIVWSLDGERVDGGEYVEIKNLHKKISIMC